MTLKDRYNRFLAWQRHPIAYANKSNATRRCANCGMESDNNFCPRCGQSLSVGRADWAAVRQNVMLLWGMESRSLPYTIVQLLLRPGHLISDYINGRRQACYPPIKMLVLLALLFGVLEYFNIVTDNGQFEIDSKSEMWSIVSKWTNENYGWSTLAFCSLFILPTWAVFRFSPRNTMHALPAGFFIQAFMASLLLIMNIFEALIGMPFPVSIIYFVFIYRHIFGYGWWGTIWRIAVCFGVGFLMLFWMIISVDFLSDGNITKSMDRQTFVGVEIFFLVAIAIAIAVPTLISRYRYKKHNEN